MRTSEWTKATRTYVVATGVRQDGALQVERRDDREQVVRAGT